MQVKEFDKILEKHVRHVIMPQLRSPLNIFALGGALGAHLLSAENMRPQLEGVGILHGDDIDTEKMRDFLVGGFEATPTVTLFGVRFDKGDAESLLRAFGLRWPERPVSAEATGD